MCIIRTCCGAMNLRAGNYFAAGYTIVLGLIGVILSSIGIGFLNELDDDSQVLRVAKILMAIILAVYILWVLSGALLVFGIYKSVRGMFVPWMVVTIILTVLTGIGIIQSFVAIAAVFRTAQTAINFIIQVVIFCCNIYALVAVFSFYRTNCEEPRDTNVA